MNGWHGFHNRLKGECLLNHFLILVLIFLRFVELFHQIAVPIAMHPGPVLVDAEIFGDILAVKLEIRNDKQPRAIGAR